jgi:hypothetical protein
MLMVFRRAKASAEAHPLHLYMSPKSTSAKFAHLTLLCFNASALSLDNPELLCNSGNNRPTRTMKNLETRIVAHPFTRKTAIALTLLATAEISFGATIYWKSDASANSDFNTAANWSAAFTTSSDAFRVGGITSTYPYSANLCKLTTGFGSYSSTVNDTLTVGLLYTGNFELDCGANTVYFKSIIVGDTKVTGQNPSVFTLTSGKLTRGDNANDTGYMTVGRNATGGSTTNGIGYLYVNGGELAMDRLTIGELTAGNTVAGEGHVVLQNNGIINLPCERVFTPPIGLRVYNGDFTWIDNGNSAVTTGHLSVNTASLIFQSTDNSIGTDGKGIAVVSGLPGGDGMAEFSASAQVDVTGLASTTDWVTLVTTASGITLADASLLTPSSVAQGWGYRIQSLGGSAAALQVSKVAAQKLTCTAGSGAVTVSWNYAGWTLQAQTNSLTGTWTDVPNTDSVTATNLPTGSETNPVFYRLRY